MDKNYTIARMGKDEIKLAMDWAAKVGWNPGLGDADCFYKADPNGFFAGKRDNKIIAMGSAVVYDDSFAFCGLYIVDAEYQHQGYGLELTKERLKYIGNRNAGLDGVLNMLSKYERLGYRIAHNNARYTTKSSFISLPSLRGITPLKDIAFDILANYDRRHFPASREQFLRCWIRQSGSLSLGYLEEGDLKGYGVIRPCQEGFKIGPLFADNEKIAEILFLNLANFAPNQTIYLDIPENNTKAKELVNRYSMTKVFETARMYLKEEPNLPIHEIYGITTFELG